MNEKMNVCLMNDSFPPVIDGVANAVINYANVISDGLGKAIVVTPEYPGAVDDYPFEVVRYRSMNITEKLCGYRAGYPFSSSRRTHSPRRSSTLSTATVRSLQQ